MMCMEVEIGRKESENMNGRVCVMDREELSIGEIAKTRMVKW